jgi:hypothetical protein
MQIIPCLGYQNRLAITGCLDAGMIRYVESLSKILFIKDVTLFLSNLLRIEIQARRILKRNVLLRLDVSMTVRLGADSSFTSSGNHRTHADSPADTWTYLSCIAPG